MITKLTKEELANQINGAAVCCLIMETMLKTGDDLWIIPNDIVIQAKDAQKKAQDRKDMSKDNRIVGFIRKSFYNWFGLGRRGDECLKK